MSVSGENVPAYCIQPLPPSKHGKWVDWDSSIKSVIIYLQGVIDSADNDTIRALRVRYAERERGLRVLVRRATANLGRV